MTVRTAMLDPYATHLPVLAAAVASARPGPVLELGSGSYSTPLLHAVCAAMGRRLVTLDGDAGWLARFEAFRSEKHRLEAVVDWDATIPVETWAVVFVDHAPAWRRVHEIERLREATELMVVHDTESPHYAYEAVLQRFTHRVDYKRAVPWTSLLSMSRSLTQFNDL